MLYGKSLLFQKKRKAKQDKTENSSKRNISKDSSKAVKEMTSTLVLAWHSCVNALSDKELSRPPYVTITCHKSIALANKILNTAAQPKKDAQILRCTEVVSL